MERTGLVEMIDRYKADAESVYNTWFVSGEDDLGHFEPSAEASATRLTASMSRPCDGACTTPNMRHLAPGQSP